MKIGVQKDQNLKGKDAKKNKKQKQKQKARRKPQRSYSW
jgi:hypothetical protein